MATLFSLLTLVLFFSPAHARRGGRPIRLQSIHADVSFGAGRVDRAASVGSKGAALGDRKQEGARKVEHEVHGQDVSISITGDESGAQAMIGYMVSQLVDGTGMRLQDIIREGKKHITIDEALQELGTSLPKEVAALVKMAKDSSPALRKSFDEESIQRARQILNTMVYRSQIELDQVIFQCKEFQERNRGMFEQVSGDVARLGAQLANLGAKRVESNQCTETYDEQHKEVQEQLDQATQAYVLKKEKDELEMTRRKNDLAVFEFIMNITKCPDSAGKGKLLQLPGRAQAPVRFCAADDGLHMDFSDPQVQREIEASMTQDARLALRTALGEVSGLLLLQGANFSRGPGGFSRGPRDANLPQPKDPVMETASVQPIQYRKCVDLPDDPDRCAKVHDTMSIEWGHFRDQVDELAHEIAVDRQTYDALKGNLNEQLTAINDRKTECMETLADAISSINADTEEMNEKDEQLRDLEAEHRRMCSKFKARITSILYEEICATVTVRNAVLAHSEKTPPSVTVDCEVSDWLPKTGRCVHATGKVITCDDSCPKPDPNECGGFEAMRREVIQPNSDSGIVCPALEMQKRCAQKKCPADCELSSWSGWSKCTRDCEGGVQIKTRSVLKKPGNGGKGCDTVQEERACNTGSCDRDCTLRDWADWSPCSVACNGGWAERTRGVLAPIRGQGMCPTKTSGLRHEKRPCNEQGCAGDEICIAQQDLVIALDASGSLSRAGFETLRSFAVNLTLRYKAKYFGLETVKMGATLFGNGHLQRLSNGDIVIPPAIETQALTFDFEQVRKSLAATTWQKGFTNMAQAFAKADFLLARGGREDAQSGILVLSDGRPSFRFQTAQLAQQLKDKNIKIFMAPVISLHVLELDDLKHWASAPWSTNYERIPGFEALHENADVFIEKLLVKFCPDSISPTILKQKEELEQFMLVRESGQPDSSCAAALSEEGQFGLVDDCASKARIRGRKAFIFGRLVEAGRCISADIAVDEGYWLKYKDNHTDPPCPSGAWKLNPYWDTFVISPMR